MKAGEELTLEDTGIWALVVKNAQPYRLGAFLWTRSFMGDTADLDVMIKAQENADGIFFGRAGIQCRQCAPDVRALHYSRGQR